MKKKRIGVNGLGRIGRCFVRMALAESNVEVVVVNEIASLEETAYLLKYDSVYGVLAEDVTQKGNTLSVGGRTIASHREKTPRDVPWGDYGVDGVLDATGVFHNSREALEGCLEAGARRVLVSAPAKAADLTVVYGVNHKEIRGEHRIVSNASCTTNCLAPVLKVLDETWGVESALMTTVHCYTSGQALVDAPRGKMRRNRAAALSLVPTTTGAGKAIGLVMPSMKGKIDAIAVRVPTATVSLIDLVALVAKPPKDAETLVSALDEAAREKLRGILAVERAELVSVDFKGSTYSSIVDAPMCSTCGSQVKVVAWYDNEWGYVARLMDVMRYWTGAGD
jgi:glyceraldehyde 3-phosphate dehydrogenase